MLLSPLCHSPQSFTVCILLALKPYLVIYGVDVGLGISLDGGEEDRTTAEEGTNCKVQVVVWENDMILNI